MTCGPYRPISLVTYTTRIESANTRASASVTPALSLGLKVDLAVMGDLANVRAAKVALKDWKGNLVRVEEVQLVGAAVLKDVINWDLTDEVELWWPVGYGRQRLYTVEIYLLGEVSASRNIFHYALLMLVARVGHRGLGRGHKADWFPECRARPRTT